MTDSNSPKRKTLGIKPTDGTATRKPTGNRPVRVSDLNRKRVQAVAEGIRRAQGGAGAKSGKGGMPPADPAAGRAPRPARGDSDRPPRQGRPADGERQARPRRFDDDQSRPRRFGDEDNRPRRFGNDDRAPRRFGDDEARPRRFSDDNRPPRPRRAEGSEQPQRRFRDDESRPRRFSDDEARPRRFSDDNRPQRPRRTEGGEQPQRRFRDDESRPRRFGDDDARPRRFSDDNRPQRPRRTEGGEQPQRRFRDDESRPRRFGDDDNRPRRFGDDDRQRRAPDTGARRGDAPARRFSDTADRARPVRAERQPAHSSGDAPETSHDDGLVRLSKRMSELGLCSRREADEWIPRGWVIVDGKPVTELGSRVRADANIEIHQAARSEQGERVTVLLHKPMGYVSGQAEDGYEPAAVLFTAENQWAEDPTRKRFAPWQRKSLAPAGRLDIDSTGLLVLTQDGRVARALIGEDSNVEKEYLVRVQWHSPDGVVERNVSEVFPADKLELLRHGLSLDGVVLKPAKVSWQNEEQLRFVLREGRKRQIRRMCEQVGLEVVGLKRVRMGRIVLGDLPPGQWRFLGPFEKF
ncbi:pseudouridine synthase [Cupriavidus pinatubonensis]|uniref:Dual-specificity RNA pseudouridine synthase RluF n=1 Tax=Cupriavidus pinatubonensis TaxID=248026 RepID=A0ABM8WHL5_9BURK|nr:pseudouridine synthase [Cupriavidus pinatubonensis]CAG9166870.1 hypothetical protein LMG23994_01022 [Cupriavidus pinatubonensis]